MNNCTSNERSGAYSLAGMPMQCTISCGQWKRYGVQIKAGILSACFILLCASLQAQPAFVWAKQNAAIGASAVAVDANGNVYSMGVVGNSHDIELTKMDAAGVLLWTKQFLWAYSWLGGLAVDNDGIYITGTFQGTQDFDPGPGVFNLTVGCSGGGSGCRNAFVCKLDICGDFLWARLLGSGGNVSYAYAITLDEKENIYTTGKYTGPADFDPGAGVYNLTKGANYACKMDKDGNFVWASGYGNYESVSIAVDKSGNVFTTGSYTGTVDFDPSSSSHFLTSAGNTQDIFVLKLDSLGNYVWAGSMGGATSANPYDRGNSITTDAVGNVYVTGDFKTTDADFDPGPGVFILTTKGLQDVFVLKLTNDGDFVWVKQFGTTNEDSGTGITVDGCGNVYTCGNLGSGTADLDPGAAVYNLSGGGSFISILDASGNFVSAGFSARLVTGFVGQGWNVVVDCRGYIYTSGYFTFTIDVDPGVGTTLLSGGGQFTSKLATPVGSCSSCSSILPCSLAAPVAAFVSGDTMFCQNDCIAFTNLSSNATSWQWFFDGGTPSSSTDENPALVCYVADGTYDVTLIAANVGGTDTIKLSNYITVHPAPAAPTIVQSGDTLYCVTNQGNYFYQWYDSTEIIPGAIDSFYVPLHDGNYNVEVSNSDGCKIAVGITIIITADRHLPSGSGIVIYPNPSRDIIFIKNTIQGRVEETSMLAIYDVPGKKLYEGGFQNKIDISEFAPGVYIIEVKSLTASYRFKIIKEK